LIRALEKSRPPTSGSLDTVAGLVPELVARFGGQHLYNWKMSFGSKSNLRFRRVNFKV
jgi:hypothetical protein